MIVRVRITKLDNPQYGKILHLDLEDFLRDVLPGEVRSESDPIEAQKALAVAIRSSAMRRIKYNRRYSCDVTDSSTSYNVRPRNPASDKAIAETYAEVLTYKHDFINAKFTVSNGGRVRSSFEVWGKSDPDYLQAFDDPYDTAVLNGSGVGMSKVGARTMAIAGKTYKEILAYYYPGTELVKREGVGLVPIDFDKKLSAHFTIREFFDPAKYTNVTNKKTKRKYTCAEAEATLNGKISIDPKLVDLLEGMREDLRKTYKDAVIVITPHGGYRPTALNSAVGGAAQSQHRLGRAADFRVRYGGKTMNAADLAVYTEKYMDDHGVKGGVGMYHATDDYIHVDVRGSNVHWYDSYSSAGCPGQGGTPCLYKHGTKGAGVVLIQRKLIEMGYNIGTPDGKYGIKTVAAIKKVQASAGLTVDGIFGRATNEAMGGVLPWN